MRGLAIEDQVEAAADHTRRRASLYARTSSPNQKDNYSAEEQIHQCLKYCEQRGWSVKNIFVDECQSGKSIDRPKFQLMIERARSKEFDVIVVWKLDRFARSLVDLVNVEKMLRNHGVELCSATEYVDTTSSVGRFNYRSLASVAELERELIGERARLGLYALARERRWPNAHPPLGYDIDSNGMLMVNVSEAKLVRWIFQRYVKAKSMPELAFWLNAKATAKNQGKTKKWNPRSIKTILDNKLYAGQYHVAGYVEQVEDLRIVGQALFDNVAKTMKRYRIGTSRRPAMNPARKNEKVARVVAKYGEFLQGLAG